MRLFFLSLLFLSLACQNSATVKAEKENVIGDTVVMDLPEWYNANSFVAKRNDSIYKLLTLSPLKEGFDSLQIRIWIDCGYEISNIIVLAKNKGEWNSKFYTFTVYSGDGASGEDGKIEIRNVHIESKPPNSGWGQFSDSLLNTGVTELKDFTHFMEDYNYPIGSNITKVEIATRSRYRLYTYPELSLNSGIKSGPANLHQAMQLIEREFNFKRPCQNQVLGK